MEIVNDDEVEQVEDDSIFVPVETRPSWRSRRSCWRFISFNQEEVQDEHLHHVQQQVVQHEESTPTEEVAHEERLETPAEIRHSFLITWNKPPEYKQT